MTKYFAFGRDEQGRVWSMMFYASDVKQAKSIADGWCDANSLMFESVA